LRSGQLRELLAGCVPRRCSTTSRIWMPCSIKHPDPSEDRQRRMSPSGCVADAQAIAMKVSSHQSMVGRHDDRSYWSGTTCPINPGNLRPMPMPTPHIC
jgi:hypothetical protein